MYILDTDHVSLFQRNHPEVVARVSDEIVRAYKSLHSTFLYFQSVKIIDFDEKSQRIFRNLRGQKIRVGTQDLRIAAIAIAHDAILITRNRQDFALAPLLKIDDWSKFQSGWPG